MRENGALLEQNNKKKALIDLMRDLSQLGENESVEIEEAEQSLELIVEQAMSGIDIRQRFPEYYHKLLHSRRLRQQFLDAINLYSSTHQIGIDPFQYSVQPDLAFLKKKCPVFTNWPIFLAQTQSNLMMVFFPLAPNYRDGLETGAEPIYTLLRKDFAFNEVEYTVQIKSRLADTDTDHLKTSFDLVANETQEDVAFPIEASIHWGSYSAKVIFHASGQQQIPDIPLSAVFDSNLSSVRDSLQLTLSIPGA